MTTIEALVKHYHDSQEGSDIKDHLDVLTQYAAKCYVVTEFGFRYGASFSALLAGAPKTLITYDLTIAPQYQNRFTHLDLSTKLVFNQEDTLKCDIDFTDFLFIDTYHTYGQLSQELNRHHSKVSKYIGFHDVTTFGLIGEDKIEPGLLAAIFWFMQANPQWKISYFSYACNGLLILECK